MSNLCRRDPHGARLCGGQTGSIAGGQMTKLIEPYRDLGDQG